MGEDTTEGLVVRAKRASLTPGMDEWDDRRATGHAEYHSWCELSVTEVSCKDVQPRCWMADKQLVSDVIMSDVMSIIDVKSASTMKLHSSEVVPVKSRVDEPMHQAERSACDERHAELARDTTLEPGSVHAADAVVERSVWDMQNTRSHIAYAEWIQNATFEPSIVTFASSVALSKEVVGKFRRDVPDERVTHGRQERVCQSYIHSFVEDGEPRLRARDLWSQTFR